MVNHDLLKRHGHDARDESGGAKPWEHALEDLVELYREAGWPTDEIASGLEFAAKALRA